MRQNHYEGLNKTARKIVQRCIAATLPEPNSDMEVGVLHPFRGLPLVPGARVEVCGQIEGAFLDEGEHYADLYRYIMPSGVVYEEYIQVGPWASGPHWYLALRRPKSNKCLRTTVWSHKATGMDVRYINLNAI
jgi:hypothetical protein